MNWNGGYYLHTNGKLIYKSHGLEQRDIEESDLVVKYWKNVDIGKTPNDFVAFLKEAYLSGADEDEIIKLTSHNNLDKYISDWRLQIFGEKNESGCMV